MSLRPRGMAGRLQPSRAQRWDMRLPGADQLAVLTHIGCDLYSANTHNVIAGVRTGGACRKAGLAARYLLATLFTRRQLPALLGRRSCCVPACPSWPSLLT